MMYTYVCVMMCIMYIICVMYLCVYDVYVCVCDDVYHVYNMCDVFVCM